MNYALVAEQEFEKYQQNYGKASLTTIAENALLNSMQNMMQAQLDANMYLAKHLTDLHAENSNKVMAELQRPRNKTILRDSEGKISGVVEN